MSDPVTETPEVLKAKTLTLHWHENAAPIYTIDTQKGTNRLATGGGDNNVRIWRIGHEDQTNDSSELTVEYLSTITKHTQAINCVRFNPSGTLLATASDDGTIMVWERSEQIVKEFGQEEDEDLKESWTVKIACFSNSMSEIYDICWSPDSKYICCGLMDNIIRIFNVNTGAMVKQIAEHNHYVQGVTWDPLGEYICSQSADRSVHVYRITKSENGDFNIGPTAFYKSYKSDPLINKPGQQSVEPDINKAPLQLTFENLKRNDTSIKQTSPVTSPQQTNKIHNNTPSITVHTNQSTGNNTMNSTPILAPAVMVSSASNLTTTMDPPNQTPKHKRTYSNSSTTSTHSIFNRVASPLPAVMPSSPSVKQLELSMHHSNTSMKPRQQYLYYGETLQSFFRRLTFSPDGALLLATSGMFKSIGEDGTDVITNTVYVYTRGGINKPPIVHIPGLKKPAIAIRFSPLKYALFEGNGTNICDVFNLPYRMIFAIATQDSILIYDTQRLKCLGIASNLHYTVITDVCWSADGRSLFASSNDGFVSNITLSTELLGEPIGDFKDMASRTLDNTVASPIKDPFIPPIPTKSIHKGHLNDLQKSGGEKRNILDMLGSSVEGSNKKNHTSN